MTEPMIYHQAIRLPYRYTAGDMNTAFLEGLARGEILAGQCGDCERVIAPLQPFCPLCGGRLAHPRPVGPGGTVTTWTRDRRDRVFARIKLDGADSEILHRVEGAAAVGSRVSPRWAAEPDREITTIETFVID